MAVKSVPRSLNNKIKLIDSLQETHGGNGFLDVSLTLLHGIIIKGRTLERLRIQGPQF